jgi:hypothetical protein
MNNITLSKQKSYRYNQLEFDILQLCIIAKYKRTLKRELFRMKKWMYSSEYELDNDIQNIIESPLFRMNIPDDTDVYPYIKIYKALFFGNSFEKYM